MYECDDFAGIFENTYDEFDDSSEVIACEYFSDVDVVMEKKSTAKPSFAMRRLKDRLNAPRGEAAKYANKLYREHPISKQITQKFNDAKAYAAKGDIEKAKSTWESSIDLIYKMKEVYNKEIPKDDVFDKRWARAHSGMRPVTSVRKVFMISCDKQVQYVKQQIRKLDMEKKK